MSEVLAAYKKLRKLAAELSFEESFKAVWAYAQARQVKGFAFPADVEQHAQLKNDPHAQPYPWQLEAIVQEVILHSGDVSQRGRSLKRWDDLAAAINALRATEDAIHAEALTADNVMQEMLRIAHQQFLWQQMPSGRLISRYYQIFKGDGVAPICLALTGLSVAKIYAMGASLWAHYSERPFVTWPWTSETPSITRYDMERFFKLYGTDVYALRQRIKAARPQIDETFGYDHRIIRGTPLVSFRRMGSTLISCPLPTLLVWRFTSGLYYNLVGDDGFFNAFGASFQAYIGEALRRAVDGSEVRCLGEERFGTRKKPKDSVDWVAVDRHGAAFIECKSKRLTLKARTKLTDRSDIQRDIDSLASFIVQLYESIGDYQDDKYPSLPFDSNRAVFPIIVTPEDWFPLGTHFWADLQERIAARLPGSRARPGIVDELPYILASCDELERAAQIIAKTGVRGLFDGYRNGEFSGWMLDRYMAQAFPQDYKAARDLFPESFDEIKACVA